jgi:hypothetical protein
LLRPILHKPNAVGRRSYWLRGESLVIQGRGSSDEYISPAIDLPHSPHQPPNMTGNFQNLQTQLNSLRDEVGALRDQVTRLNDIQAIRTLHFKYGYYWDNVLFEQVIDLFTNDVKVTPSLKILNTVILPRRSLPWKRRCPSYLRRLQ